MLKWIYNYAIEFNANPHIFICLATLIPLNNKKIIKYCVCFETLSISSLKAHLSMNKVYVIWNQRRTKHIKQH